MSSLSERPRRLRRQKTDSREDPASECLSPSRSTDEKAPESTPLPDACLVCDAPIHKNSVLFHCECVVALCQNCALLQVAAQPNTFHKGLICPYCRTPSDTIKGVEECLEEENRLIAASIRRNKIRTSRNEDGIKKSLACLLNDGFTMGLIALKDLENPEWSSPNATHALRLELARLEATYEYATKNKITNLKQINQLSLGPLELLSITRNVILERALAIQSFKGPDKPQSPPVNNVIQPACDDEDEVEVVNDPDEVKSGGSPKADELSDGSQKKSHSISSISFPRFPDGAKVLICAGTLSGIYGTVIGYTASGESVRIEYVDTAGKTRKTAVMRKNVTAADPSEVFVDSEKEATSLKDTTQRFCLCEDIQKGIYVKCMVGKHGCNGWVHPECCYDLKTKSVTELQSIDSNGYICPLCRDSSRACASPPTAESSSNRQQSEMFLPGNKVKITVGKYAGLDGLIIKTHRPGVMVVQIQEVNGFPKKVTIKCSKLRHSSSTEPIVIASPPPIPLLNSSSSARRALLAAAYLKDNKLQLEPYKSLPKPQDDHNSIQNHLNMQALLGAPAILRNAPVGGRGPMDALNHNFLGALPQNNIRVVNGIVDPDLLAGNGANDNRANFDDDKNANESGDKESFLITSWVSDVYRIVPVLFGESISNNANQVSSFVVKSLFERGKNLNFSTKPLAKSIFERFSLYISRVDDLENTLQRDLEKAKQVLEVQEGRVETESARNVLESKILQNLLHTFEGFKNLNIQCPALNLVFRVFNWSSLVFRRLFESDESLVPKTEKVILLRNGQDFTQQATRLADLESPANPNHIQEDSKLTDSDSPIAQSKDSKDPKVIVALVSNLTGFWLKRVSSLISDDGGDIDVGEKETPTASGSSSILPTNNGNQETLLTLSKLIQSGDGANNGANLANMILQHNRLQNSNNLFNVGGARAIRQSPTMMPQTLLGNYTQQHLASNHPVDNGYSGPLLSGLGAANAANTLSMKTLGKILPNFNATGGNSFMGNANINQISGNMGIFQANNMDFNANRKNDYFSNFSNSKFKLPNNNIIGIPNNNLLLNPAFNILNKNAPMRLNNTGVGTQNINSQMQYLQQLQLQQLQQQIFQKGEPHPALSLAQQQLAGKAQAMPKGLQTGNSNGNVNPLLSSISRTAPGIVGSTENSPRGTNVVSNAASTTNTNGGVNGRSAILDDLHSALNNTFLANGNNSLESQATWMNNINLLQQSSNVLVNNNNKNAFANNTNRIKDLIANITNANNPSVVTALGYPNTDNNVQKSSEVANEQRENHNEKDTDTSKGKPAEKKKSGMLSINTVVFMNLTIRFADNSQHSFPEPLETWFFIGQIVEQKQNKEGQVTYLISFPVLNETTELDFQTIQDNMFFGLPEGGRIISEELLTKYLHNDQTEEREEEEEDPKITSSRDNNDDSVSIGQQEADVANRKRKSANAGLTDNHNTKAVNNGDLSEMDDFGR